MSRWRFAVPVIPVLAALLAGCESGTEPAGMVGFEYCGAGESARGELFEYDAEDNLIRTRAFDAGGKPLYEWNYRYSGGLLVSESGKGSIPGLGRLDESSLYEYDAEGNRIRSERIMNGAPPSCTEHVRDTAARVIRDYTCGTGILSGIRNLDSLGRRISSRSFSPDGSPILFDTIAYDDSGSTVRIFWATDGTLEPIKILNYDSRGTLRSERSMVANATAWQTTFYSRSGSLETYESIKEDGTRIARGYSDLSPTGKPLKTIRCSSY